MTVAIILDFDSAQKERAIAHGFVERRVLVREVVCVSEQEKERLESFVMREVKPFRFAVTDCWGAGVG